MLRCESNRRCETYFRRKSILRIRAKLTSIGQNSAIAYFQYSSDSRIASSYGGRAARKVDRFVGDEPKGNEGWIPSKLMGSSGETDRSSASSDSSPC